MPTFTIDLAVKVEVSAADLPDALATLSCAVEDIQGNQEDRETDAAEDDLLAAVATAIDVARPAARRGAAR